MKISAFLTELKRRRVYRALAVYVVAAWVAIQVANDTFPALGLPSWTITFVVVLTLVGLPIVAVLGWLFDVTLDRGGREVGAGGGGAVAADAVGAASSAPVPVAAGFRGPAVAVWAARRARLGSAAVLLLLLTLAGWSAWYLAVPRPVPLAAGSVAILPFAYTGSGEAEYLSEGMLDLLAARLDGAGHLHAVDPGAVLKMAEPRLQRDADAGAAYTVARSLGAAYFVIGSVVQVGTRLHITAAIYEVDRLPRRAATAAEEGDADGILELVDRLALRLLTGLLGQRAVALDESGSSSTTSLAALRAYLAGESALRAGRTQEAISLLETATRADSTFALAHYRLAVAAEWTGDRALARQSMRAALRNEDRLGRVDRIRLQAWSASTEDRPSVAERLYRELLRERPHDADAWYGLGETLFHGNLLRGRPIAEAGEPLTRAVELDAGRPEALFHLVQLALAAGQTERAQSLAALLEAGGIWARMLDVTRAWFAAGPAGEAALLERLRGADEDEILTATFQLAHVGAVGGASRVAAVLLEPVRPAEQRGRAHTELATLAMAAGRPQQAADHLAEARRLLRQPLISRRVGLALAPLTTPDPQSLRTLQSELLAGGSATPGEAAFNRFVAALLDLRLGDARAALAHADSIEQAGAGTAAAAALATLAHLIRGAEAAAGRRQDEVVQALELAPLDLEELAAVLPPGGGVSVTLVWLRAELLAMAGRREEALGWYAALIGPGVALLGPAHLRRAELLDQLGRPDSATAEYARFLKLWADAEADQRAIVERVRTRLGRLQ
jgi:TolB-like protein